ncbi:MAG: site-2 protease family protein [Terracidiphilus sp.]|jgi:Zn-dependent protease
MPSQQRGSIHLFRLAGVDIYLHWSWFLVAIMEVESRQGRYSSILWNVFEYVALFLIVLTHELGHSLACRQVGGTANRILLWPFGGVAYVDPPQRPGATLWSIAAGPLVNVALMPILFAAYWLSRSAGWAHTMPDAYRLLRSVLAINIGLLVFNILPIYPLDGGQILRSLLWFPLGRARSLMVATIVGLLGIIGFFGLAVFFHSAWTGAIAVFMLLNCWAGLRRAQALLRLAKLPRRKGFACPNCRTEPLLGEKWKCGQCGLGFDTFLSGAVCPHCGAQYPTTTCADCGKSYPMNEWIDRGVAGLGVVNGGFAAR